MKTTSRIDLAICGIFLLMIGGGIVATHDAPSSFLPAIGGGIIGFFYFWQKHRLNQADTFEKIFTRFNERYSDLQERLQVISHKTNLEMGDTLVLQRYFNLCAEEYLFYTRGVIYSEVWNSWKTGIAFYLNKRQIREYWDSEVDSESHYGLTSQLILGDRANVPRIVKAA